MDLIKLNLDLTNVEKNLINKYWNTLLRTKIKNISYNKFIKKPYIENYIIQLSIILDDNTLIKSIIELIESNNINNDELLLFIKNYFEYDKKVLDILYKKIDILNYEEKQKIFIYIIMYVIKYFRFYQTICELLFDSRNEDNELYNFIFVYIKNKESETELYINNSMKYKIFHYYLEDLLISFTELYNIFSLIGNNDNVNNNNVINNNVIKNLFLKNVFISWYNIYKKDIINNNINDKIKKYIIKRSILSRILCLSTA
jgi:hypothetical protein